MSCGWAKGAPLILEERARSITAQAMCGARGRLFRPFCHLSFRQIFSPPIFDWLVIRGNIVLLRGNFGVNAASAFPLNCCAHDSNFFVNTQDFERRKQSIDRMEGENSEKNLEQLAQMDDRLELATPGGCSVYFAQVNAVCNVDSFCHDSSFGGQCCSVESGPIHRGSAQGTCFRKRLRLCTIHSQKLLWLNKSDPLCSSAVNAAAGQLVVMQQSPLYIQLPSPHMRLAVVHEKD